MEKADIPPSISINFRVCRQFVEFCKRLAWNGLRFRGKESLLKMTWSWHLSLLEKFAVNLQCAIMKYKIIRKAMVLERVEVNSLTFTHY